MTKLSSSEARTKRHLRNNVWSMVLFSLVLSAFSFGIGKDGYVIACMALVSCLAGYALLVDSLSARMNTVGLYLSLAFFWIVSQFVLPQGSTRIAALLPILIFTVSIAKSGFQSYVPILVFVAATGILHSSGIVPDVNAFLPEWLMLCLIWTISFYLTIFQISLACKRYDSSLDQIVELEAQLREEKSSLSLKLDLLRQANEIYKSENDRLAHQVLKEAKLTSSLITSRAEASEMANAIHHDLREPLRSIVSFSQLIRRRLSATSTSPEVDDYLAYAEDGGQRMAKMLVDLMSYTKTDDEEVSFRIINLNEVLNEVTLNLRDLIDRTNAIVDIEVLPSVFGHRTQLIQLFQNIISNALKFVRSDVNPKISVRVRVNEKNQEVIEIEDNGIGIASQDIDKVFGLFNRVHGSEIYEGSGVGLSLCKRIALAHGADLSLSSTLGEGTVFKLVFSEYASNTDTTKRDVLSEIVLP